MECGKMEVEIQIICHVSKTHPPPLMGHANPTFMLLNPESSHHIDFKSGRALHQQKICLALWK